jgi:hypothetical protein
MYSSDTDDSGVLFSANSIGHKGAEALAKALHDNKTLMVLDLR